MAAHLSIVKPEAGTNLVTNPSLELATTGYTAVGSAIARSSAAAAFGAYSLAVTPTAGVGDGVFFGTIAISIGNNVAFSVYVKGVNGVPYTAYVGSTGGAVLGTPTYFTGNGRWQRVVVLYTETATNNRRLYLTKNNSASVGVFYADGWQCEGIAYATTYIDGEQDGCRWSAAPHGSTSVRDAQSRAGGRIVPLMDDADYLTGWSTLLGIGMPTVKNIGIPLALLGGLQYQRTLRDTRTVQLLGELVGDDYADLHRRRQNLIDLVKADAVYPAQPFWLRYSDDADPYNKPLRVRAVYESGLDWAAVKGDSMQIALRMLCMDPLWYEELDSSAVLTFVYSVSNANYILQRDTTGLWRALGVGANAFVDDLAIDKNGILYAAGNFTSIGGVATRGIAKWDGTIWSALGSGALDGQVTALKIGPDGTTLYAGGTFTQMGGVANTPMIARWDGSAWNAMGTGGSGVTTGVAVISINGSGHIFAGGDFTGMGGVANTARLARWDGSAWNALSTGANDTVFAMALDVSNNLYVAGLFTTVGGVSATGIAKWNGTAFSNIGNLSGGTVQGLALAIGLDGLVYLGGNFTSVGGVSANYIAKYNGTAWQPLGSGLDNDAQALFVSKNRGLIVGGRFTTAGGMTLSTDRMARWNGSAWLPMDVDLPGSPILSAIIEANDHQVFPTLTIGFTTSGTATASYVNQMTATANAGTAEVAPIVRFTGPGTLVSLTNTTNGKQLLFNGLTLLAGEEAVLDLTPQNFSFVSSFRGNLMNYIANPSALGTWRLAPGANNISLLIMGSDANTLCKMTWRAAHWSADAVAV